MFQQISSGPGPVQANHNHLCKMGRGLDNDWLRCGSSVTGCRCIQLCPCLSNMGRVWYDVWQKSVEAEWLLSAMFHVALIGYRSIHLHPEAFWSVTVDNAHWVSMIMPFGSQKLTEIPDHFATHLKIWGSGLAGWDSSAWGCFKAPCPF